MTPTEPATASPTSRRSRLALAAFMTGAGVMHFVKPGFFEAIVPEWIGHEKELVAASGVAEIAAGAMLVSPRSSRIGAWWTLVVLVAVYPANIQMAVDASPPESVEDWAVLVRLPLQLPLFLWALQHTCLRAGARAADRV